MTLILKSNPMNLNGSSLNGVDLWRRNMEMNTKKKIDRRIFKKSPDELQEYMMFKRRGSRTPAKKGKGMKYERAQEKEKSRNLVSDN